MSLLLALGVALRICADPNNMPFSNRALQGFENKIAAVLADELHETPTYTWWAQRRGFLRNTVKAGLCDVVIGITPGAGPIATTAPYYRSTYVFITRGGSVPAITSFDDPRLRSLKVGIHVIGADYNGLPPAVALANRGIIGNVVGYSIYGNYDEPSPPSKLIDAVAKDDVDVAIVWGPLAGYYASREPVTLTLSPVTTHSAIPFTYDIAVGVREDSTALRARLDRALVARRVAIRRILTTYGVPCV